MADHWQISFDHGHQQRYLPDRRAVLSYVLSIGPRAASPRFEVFAERERPARPGGGPAGRTFARVDVIDLSRPGEVERLRAELAGLDGPGQPDAPGQAAAPGDRP
ncbi:MAG TPA: hypothetical protein VIF35_06110 [Streptosporangiaceae bacterium]|jgi:hypothetical protein